MTWQMAIEPIVIPIVKQGGAHIPARIIPHPFHKESPTPYSLCHVRSVHAAAPPPPLSYAGCYIQYHRLFSDAATGGAVYLEFWADGCVGGGVT